MNARVVIAILAVAVGAAVAGYLAGSYWLAPPVPKPDRASIGEPAPHFALPNLAGGETTVEDLRGQAVLLNFWATWCAPCRREMPALMALHEELAGAGAAVVGIALDREADVRAYVAELGVAYPMLLAGDIDGTRLAQRYGNGQVLLPFSVFLAPDGTVAHMELGEVSIEDARRRLRTLAAENPG